jgi:hypothetical protein
LAFVRPVAAAPASQIGSGQPEHDLYIFITSSGGLYGAEQLTFALKKHSL